jgi:hypothetical protein
MLRLVIAPKTATIAPGALQQFTARLLDEEFIDRPPALAATAKEGIEWQESKLRDEPRLKAESIADRKTGGPTGPYDPLTAADRQGRDPVYSSDPNDYDPRRAEGQNPLIPASQAEHAEWHRQNPGKTRLDTLPVAGEQKRPSVVINTSYAGIYDYPKEEVEWLDRHRGKTHAHYEAFINAPALPALKVKWSATGGTIDENGLFTAPNSDATVSVTAASVDNAENFDTAVVAVGKGGAVDRNAMQTSQYGETVGNRASIIGRGDGRVTRQGEFVGDGAGQYDGRDTFGNKFDPKAPGSGSTGEFSTVTPLTQVQLEALAAANVPAASNTAPLTQAQLTALVAAGVPAKTV